MICWVNMCPHKKKRMQWTHGLINSSLLMLYWKSVILTSPKKRDHGMVDLQPVLSETLKQDSSRYQVWNIDKLYTRRNMYIKNRKETTHVRQRWRLHTSFHIYVCIKEYNVCKKSGHKTLVHVKRKEYIKTSLHPSKHSS